MIKKSMLLLTIILSITSCNQPTISRLGSQGSAPDLKPVAAPENSDGTAVIVSGSAPVSGGGSSQASAPKQAKVER